MIGSARRVGEPESKEESVLFVVSGPSGCGKSTLIRRLLVDLDGLRFSVSHTTRPRREGETSGREYYFIGRPEFEAMAQSGAFLEWATVHGHFYGTSRAEVESKSAPADLVLDIDVQGARQVKRQGLPAIFVFVVPPKFEDLRARLEQRGLDDAETIRRRLQAAAQEVEAIPEFDYLIINDSLDRAEEDFKSIVRAGRCRVGPQSEDVRTVLSAFRSARLE
jgi:guanylate kinase